MFSLFTMVWYSKNVISYLPTNYPCKSPEKFALFFAPPSVYSSFFFFFFALPHRLIPPKSSRLDPRLGPLSSSSMERLESVQISIRTIAFSVLCIGYTR